MYGGQRIRRDARRRLLESIAPSRAPSPAGVVLVVGTVGMGKTTFAEDLRAEAISAGMLTGWGSASSDFSAGPLTPWIDALTELDDRVGRSTSTLTADQPPLARYRAVAQRLDELATQCPVVLILEDLHDADSATLDLLGFLGQRRPRAPWLVVATARPSYPRLPEWRGEILRLDGLDADDLIELTRSTGVELSHDDAERLRRRTDGNPLLARRLVEHGVLGDDLTPSLSSLLRAEVAEIPAEVQPVIDVASVLGTHSNGSRVAAILRTCDVDPTAALAALGSGIEGIVSVDGATVRFSHPLMRELMYDALDPERRATYHEAAARVLDTERADPLSIIRHVRRAPEATHGYDAGELAATAARLALNSGALVEAVDHAEFARDVITRHGSDDQRAAAALGLADAQTWAGRISAGEETLRDVGALGLALSAEMRRRIVRAYIRLRWREEPNASILHAESLRELSNEWLGDSTDPADQAVLHAATVCAGEIIGPGRGLIEAADAAVAAAEVSGDLLLQAEAHMARRRALIAYPSRLAERSADSKRALDLAVRINDDELIGRSQRHCFCDALARGDRVAALALIVRYDAAPTVGLREHTALREAGLATIEGRYDEAELVLRSATEELGSLGVATPTLDYFHTFIALDRGGVADLLAEYEHVIAAIADPALRSAFAWSAALAGDHERARGHLDGIVADLDAAEADHLWPVVVGIGGEAAASVGHRSCAALLARIEPFEGQCLIPAAAAAPWFGPYDRIIGLLRYRLGDIEGAIDAISRSLAITTRMHAAPWQARSHLALASVLRASGRVEEGDTHEQAGRAIAAELGMGEVFLEPCPPDTATPVLAVFDSPDANVRFERSGSGWRLERGGQTYELSRIAGLAMLHVLVSAPSTDWHALDLYAAANNVPGVRESAAGPALDDVARRAYQERYAALSEEKARAEDDHDIGRAAAASDELDALETELLRAFGLGGRPRELNDPGERARVNVKRSIGRALNAIEAHDRWLADHLRHRIVTGRFCRYRPDPYDPLHWITS